MAANRSTINYNQTLSSTSSHLNVQQNNAFYTQYPPNINNHSNNHAHNQLMNTVGIANNILNENNGIHNNTNYGNNNNMNKRRRSSRNKKSGLILQDMTPQQKCDLKRQYVVWTQQAIKQMQVKLSMLLLFIVGHNIYIYIIYGA